MYRWIWRHLPFGLPGKLAGSVLLSAAVVTLLWLVVFPWAEPLLPFDDVQVVQDSGGSNAPAGTDPGFGPSAVPTAISTQPDGTGLPGDGHDVPYDTNENSPKAHPTANKTRSR